MAARRGYIDTNIDVSLLSDTWGSDHTTVLLRKSSCTYRQFM